MHPTHSAFMNLPRDVVLGSILPTLAADFQIFSIISLGTASRALCGPDYFGEVLGQLRGDAPQSGDAPLAICSRMRMNLRGVNWLDGDLRGIQAILRQAWTQRDPAPLLSCMPRQTVSDWEQYIKRRAEALQEDVTVWETMTPLPRLELSLPVSLKEAVDRAIHSGQGILSVLLTTAEAQAEAEAKEDLGLEDILASHLPSLDQNEQLALMDELFTNPKLRAIESVHLGLAPLSEGVAQQWLDLQIEKGALADICSRDRKLGEVSPCLRVIELVCRQFGPESEARTRYLQIIERGLEGRQQRISSGDLDALVKVLDRLPRNSLWRWIRFNEAGFEKAPPANLDSAVLNRALESLSVSTDLQALDPSQYLIPIDQSSNSSNSSQTTQATAGRRKKRQKCALM